jgi:hypothetical protein
MLGIWAGWQYGPIDNSLTASFQTWYGTGAPQYKIPEVSRSFDLEKDRKAFPGIGDYQLVKSSDAHMLGDILEREFFLELKEISISGIISKLRNG